MNLIIACLKEIVESLLRNARKAICRDEKIFPEIQKIIKVISSDGIYVSPDFYSEERCKCIREKIDELLNKSDTVVWVDEAGSDKRIFFAEKLDPLFKEFYESKFIRDALKQYEGLHDPVGLVLASRIDFVQGNVGSGNGWHRDSPTTHQFKAICYLNDVNNTNGPFQFIIGSHRKIKVVGSYIKKIFKPSQFRFSQKEIENYIYYYKPEARVVCGKSGTLVLSDTKGIHRGTPLQMGTRYAMTCYFWNKNVPEHFDKYNQSDL